MTTAILGGQSPELIRTGETEQKNSPTKGLTCLMCQFYKETVLGCRNTLHLQVDRVEAYMKKQSVTKWFLVLFIGAVFSAYPVYAQEDNEEQNDGENQELTEGQNGQQGEGVGQQKTMTQGQLAIILARRLGLVVGTPLSASPVAAILALEQVGVSPRGGWSSESEVTTGDLASVLNIMLGNEVDETADDQAQAEVDATIASVANITSALATAGIISSGQRESLSPASSTFNDPLDRLPPGRPVDTFQVILSDEKPFIPPGLPPLTPN
jgi:hypothetical protein